jgi:hypothetical protein
MSVRPVSRVVGATPEAVSDVLRNGWLYASWVVGASRIRGVDARWPSAGSSLAHSVGLWPLLFSDRTTSTLENLPSRLELKARAWPAGEGRVSIVIEPLDDGLRSLVSISESATSGPANLIPPAVQQPLIRLRNVEALRRLAMLAEGRGSSEVES